MVPWHGSKGETCLLLWHVRVEWTMERMLWCSFGDVDVADNASMRIRL